MGVNQERSAVIILKVLELSLQNPLHPFFATNSRIGRGTSLLRGVAAGCRRAILLCSEGTLQRFASLGLKSRIDARKRV